MFKKRLAVAYLKGLYQNLAALGGLVVSVLATEPTGYSVAGSSIPELTWSDRIKSLFVVNQCVAWVVSKAPQNSI
jgi:hypothetical protein